MLRYRVPGPEPYRSGGVEDCVPPEELMATARQFAEDLGGKGPPAMRLAKEAMNAIEGMSLRDGCRFEQNTTAELGRHPDSREAMAAFVERRRPRFGDAWGQGRSMFALPITPACLAVPARARAENSTGAP
jgi:enoyl-CoA hydratase